MLCLGHCGGSSFSWPTVVLVVPKKRIQEDSMVQVSIGGGGGASNGPTLPPKKSCKALN